MQNKLETKVDPEAELSNALRMFTRLAPQCSVANRAAGMVKLAPQKKQMGILNNEMEETLLCINLAKKGQHAVRDATIKSDIRQSIATYDNQDAELRDENWQQAELDCLNYIAKKNIIDLFKKVPSEADELAMLDNAHKRLRRMENRLDLATKRLCNVNTENKQIRDEINILLVERNAFNIQWNRTISKLVKGKEYLMDILEIASMIFADRDEWCRKLGTLKWKGLYHLNKDISEMQGYIGELNHLAKLEEFLRVKGTKRYCEADVKEEQKRLEEIARCEQKIAAYDALLDEIFTYAGTENVASIINHFNRHEIENFSVFMLLCEVMQQCIFLSKNVEEMRQSIMDRNDMNEARSEKEDKDLADLHRQLSQQLNRIQHKLQLNNAAEVIFNKVLSDISDVFSLVQCNQTPLMSLLGNHSVVTKWNVYKFLIIMELEIKSLIQVAYGAVEPTTQAKVTEKTVIAGPYKENIEPNRLETLVPYQPCAYCVEDYLMNSVFETPAVLADKEYIESIFHLEEVNTKFGIYTLTVLGKRHPLRAKE